MKEQVIRYDVYDKRNRWMGSYSTSLSRPNQPSALQMAGINCKQTQGKLIAVHESGLEEEVLNLIIKKETIK